MATLILWIFVLASYYISPIISYTYLKFRQPCFWNDFNFLLKHKYTLIDINTTNTKKSGNPDFLNLELFIEWFMIFLLKKNTKVFGEKSSKPEACHKNLFILILSFVPQTYPSLYTVNMPNNDIIQNISVQHNCLLVTTS